MKVSVYSRNKNGDGKYRYSRVKQGRGHRLSNAEGPFYLRYKNLIGKSVWEPAGDVLEKALEAAETRVHALEAQRRGLTVQELEDIENANRVPIKVACDEFLKLKAGKAAKTVAAYSLHIKEFQEAIGSKVRFMDAIDAAVMRRYRDSMAKRGLSAKTQHTRLLTITFLLKKSGMKNPLAWDEFPTYEVEHAVPYTQDELKKLFAAMTERERLAFRFFLGSGLREAEVTYTEWADLDLTRGTVTVRPKHDVRFTPKSHESRTVPLPAALVKELREAKDLRQSKRWVFVNDSGKPEKHFLRRLKAVAKRAGLNCGHCITITSDLNKQQRIEAVQKIHASQTRDERFADFDKPMTLEREITCAKHPICKNFFLHRFRKTCATRWSEAGVSVRQIQVWLGHKDLSTTQRYLGTGDMHAPQTRAKIDSAFGD